jgi:hypothetical protein
MLAIVVDDGKIKIAIEGCGRDRLPYAAIHARIADGVFDLDQSALKGPVVPDSRSASIEGWVPI